MSLINQSGLSFTADGELIFPLHNIRENRNIYTVFVGGDFDGGTITALLSGDNTNFVAIKDASGTAISLTSGDIFNFEVQSDSLDQPMKLKIALAGSTSPSINVRIYDSK